MSLKRKMMGNSVASAGSIGWSALIQLISVPILTSAWGLDKYGQWLMLSTIPTYFALSDLGFATAATSDMTMAFAKDRKDAVLSTFQSVWTLLVLISLLALLLCSPLLWGPMVGIASSFVLWPHESAALFWMIAYSAAALCSRVILAGFRSTGHYASGTILYDFIQFLEGVAALTVAYQGGSFVDCALAYFGVRLANILVCYVYLRHTVPWLYLGFSNARKSELQRLLNPALGAMAIPTALAINMQGMILIAGAVVSPAAAAVLGAVRTASRIAIQVVGIINRATMPEFSAALAQGNHSILSKLLKLNILSVVFVLLPGVLGFSVFGQYLVSLWSNSRIIPPEDFVVIMGLAMFFQGIWFFASNLLISINAHGAFARLLLPVSILSIIVSIPVARSFGLLGVGLVVMISEMIVAFGVMASIRSRWYVLVNNSLSKSVAQQKN